MSATDLAAVVIAVAALGVTAVAVLLIVQLRRATDELGEVLSTLRTDVDRTMVRLQDQVAAIEDELARVDGLVESVERVSARADTLSRVTYGAVARPVIRTAAVVKGTTRAARLLRRGHGDEVDEQAG